MPTFEYMSLQDFANSREKALSRDIIQDINPIGVSLVFAAMKRGKSLLALSCAKAVANEESDWLGMPINRPGYVLYFGLDDSNKVLHERLDQYAHLPNFYVINKNKYAEYCSDPSLRGLTPHAKFNFIVNDFIDSFGSVSLVVADTFEKIRDTQTLRSYANEVEEVATLKNNAERRGYNLLLVHHTTKFKSGDIFESFYGSNGLGAEVDVMLALTDSVDSEYQILYARGNAFEDKRILIHRNQDLTYECPQMEESSLIEDCPDKAYVQVIKYFTKKSWNANTSYYCYQGEYQDFITELDLDIDPRSLGKLLKKYKDAFLEQHICFEIQHSRKGNYLKMWINRN